MKNTFLEVNVFKLKERRGLKSRLEHKQKLNYKN